MKYYLLTLMALTAIALALWSGFGGFREVNPEVCLLDTLVLIGQQENSSLFISGNVNDNIAKSIETSYNISPDSKFGLSAGFPAKKKYFGVVLGAKQAGVINNAELKYKVVKIDNTRALMASFPYTGLVSGYISYLKVYPKLKRVLRENSLPEDMPLIRIVNSTTKNIDYAILLDRLKD